MLTALKKEGRFRRDRLRRERRMQLAVICLFAAAAACPPGAASPAATSLGDLTSKPLSKQRMRAANEATPRAGTASWRERHIPADFGLPVAVGDKLCLNFSCDGQQDLIEVRMMLS